MEPAIKLGTGDRAPTRELLHFLSHPIAQLEESRSQSVELVLEPWGGGCGSPQSMLQPAEKKPDPTGLRVQPFVEIRRRKACRDLVQLRRQGSRKRAGDVLDKPALEERAHGFRGRWALELQ